MKGVSKPANELLKIGNSTNNSTISISSVDDSKKKYVLVPDNQIVHNGATLYAIKSLRSFGDVKAGTLGGYIESEANLSHSGNCWVYDNAKVYGKAKVYDRAKVYGSAKVAGTCQVVDNGEVFGNAVITDDYIVGEDMEINK